MLYAMCTQVNQVLSQLSCTYVLATRTVVKLFNRKGLCWLQNVSYMSVAGYKVPSIPHIVPIRMKGSIMRKTPQLQL